MNRDETKVYMEDLCKRIKEKKLKNVDAHKAIGVSEATFYNWKNGVYTMTDEQKGMLEEWIAHPDEYTSEHDKEDGKRRISESDKVLMNRTKNAESQEEKEWYARQLADRQEKAKPEQMTDIDLKRACGMKCATCAMFPCNVGRERVKRGMDMSPEMAKEQKLKKQEAHQREQKETAAVRQEPVIETAQADEKEYDINEVALAFGTTRPSRIRALMSMCDVDKLTFENVVKMFDLLCRSSDLAEELEETYEERKHGGRDQTGRG